MAGLAAGCQTFTPAQSIASARQLAAGHGFTASRLDAGGFPVLAYHRGLDSGADRLVVYIEGDGRAFITRRRIAANPTPRNPVALIMALADPSPAIAYIARPCQFIDPLPAVCKPRYWTSHRYSGEVVDVLDHAIRELQEHGSFREIGLVGYSGGGVVAALLARHRHDVEWLVTVAANLDHAAWTAWHGDTPLTGSLNPADHAESLGGIAQLHIAGGDDETVPPELIRDFVDGLPPDTTVGFVVIDGADHDDWPEIWPQRICGLWFWQQVPACAADR